MLVLREANGKGWHELPQLVAFNGMWGTDDEALFAFDNDWKKYFCILTKDELAAIEAENLAAEKAKLKGF